MSVLIFKAPFYAPNSKTETGSGRGGLAQYIATREGVETVNRSGMVGYVGERTGSCGLFSDDGEPIVLSKVKDEVEHHPGNVWGMIFSLTREDAERLGYKQRNAARNSTLMMTIFDRFRCSYFRVFRICLW